MPDLPEPATPFTKFCIVIAMIVCFLIGWNKSLWVAWARALAEPAKTDERKTAPMKVD
jgi:hypothetical protein